MLRVSGDEPRRLDPCDEEHGYTAFFASIDTLLIGRRTYDVVCGFPGWPYEGKRVHVLTHHPVAARHGERIVTGTPTELLAQLPDAQAMLFERGEPGPALELVGSQQFNKGLVQRRYRTAVRATPAAR